MRMSVHFEGRQQTLLSLFPCLVQEMDEGASVLLVEAGAA